MDHQQRKEMLMRLIEIWEDFLDEKGITIHNQEKEETDNPSNVYGTDYGKLESELENALISYGLLNEESEDC